MVLHNSSGGSRVWFAWRAALLALCFGTVLSGSAAAEGQDAGDKPLAVQSQPFRFKDGDEAPSYALRLGEGSTPDVILFFISGSGCTSVKHRLAPFFDPIRKSINAMVLALQKRAIDEEDRTGASCSPAFHKTDHVDQTIADQREFIDAQLALAAPKPKAVVLLGASEGAVVAAKIAAADSRVTHLGLIGGGGTTVRENLKALSRTTWYLRSPDSSFAVIAADPENTSAQVWGHSYKYWASLLDINIGDELVKLDIPIVAAMGEKDEAVPVEAARELKTRFDNLGKANLQLLVFLNANHRLEDKDNAKSYAKDFLFCLAGAVRDSPVQGTTDAGQRGVAPISRSPVTGDAHED